MAKSIFDVQPHQISKDPSSYSYLIYGEPKSGKTTLASQFPSPLLLAFERGYKALAGVMAMNIDTWSEAKSALRELKTSQGKEAYRTIIIDTADIAYTLCEKYIINNYDPGPNKPAPETIPDIPFGGGYKMAEKEFDDFIRGIINAGYGLVIISHNKDKTVKDEAGQEYDKIMPTLESKAALVCNRACDVIGYSKIINENDVRLYLRGNGRVTAGGRLKHIKHCIPMDYDTLCEAVAEAAAKEAEIKKTEATIDKDNSIISAEMEYDFEGLKAEAIKLGKEFVAKDPKNATKLSEIIRAYLGEDKQLMTCTEKQVDSIYHIVEELKKL